MFLYNTLISTVFTSICCTFPDTCYHKVPVAPNKAIYVQLVTVNHYQGILAANKSGKQLDLTFLFEQLILNRHIYIRPSLKLFY